MGYRHALKKIEDIYNAVLELEQQEVKSQRSIDLVLESIKIAFDMVQYEHEYDDSDVEGVEDLENTDVPTEEYAAEDQEQEEYTAEEGYEYTTEEQEQEEYTAEEGYEYTTEEQEQEEYVAEEGYEYTTEEQEKVEYEYAAGDVIEPSPIIIDDIEPIVDIVDKIETNEPTENYNSSNSNPASEEEEDVSRLVVAYNKKRRERYRKLLSLYVDNNAVAASTTSEKPAMRAVSKVVAQRAAQAAQSAAFADIMEALPEPFNGLNEDGIRLLSNELFAGDINALTATLLAIDAQPNLEEAIYYIAENFVWDGDSDAAKLLFTLLQRRFA